MTERLPHFEIIRNEYPMAGVGGGDKPWRKPFHGRLVKNGRLIWSTPNYVHKNGVRRAIAIASGPFGVPTVETPPQDGKRYVWHSGYGWLEVRDLT